MKTITATTPPITAWSTPEDVDMAVVSSEEVRRGGMTRREEVRTREKGKIRVRVCSSHTTGGDKKKTEKRQDSEYSSMYKKQRNHNGREEKKHWGWWMNIGGNERRMMKGSRNRAGENNGESDRGKAKRKDKNRGAKKYVRI